MVQKKSAKKTMKKPKRKKIDTSYQPKIGVIGIGGGGGSIVGEIAKSIAKKRIPHSNRIKFIVANVDEQAIKTAPKQAGVFYFGQNLTHGLGCGMDVNLGKEAALQKKKGIENLLKKCDFCILISCLGGGTGSGATPVFAEISKDLGILTMGICTLPFRFEGRERTRIAQNSLEKIKSNLNAFVIIPNQRIFRLIGQETPIHKSLSAMNNILVKTLEGLIETLYSPGLINLDFSDFKATMDKETGLAYLNCQEFSGPHRAEKAVESVLKNPLMNYDITGGERMLFNIAGAKDMKMSEVEHISKRISDFNPQAKIIFGVLQDNRHKSKIKITLLAMGCGAEKPKPKTQKPKPPARNVVATGGRQSKIQKEAKEIKEEKVQELVSKKKKEKKEVKKGAEKKKIAVRKKRKNPEKKSKIVKKITVRRNAVDLHRQVEEDEKKMLEEESKWDVPAFLRETDNS